MMERVTVRSDAFRFLNALGGGALVFLVASYFLVQKILEGALPVAALYLYVGLGIVALILTFLGTKQIFDGKQGRYELRRTLFGVTLARKIRPLSDFKSIEIDPRPVRVRGKHGNIFRVTLKGTDGERFIKTCHAPEEADELANKIARATGLGIVKKSP